MDSPGSSVRPIRRRWPLGIWFLGGVGVLGLVGIVVGGWLLHQRYPWIFELARQSQEMAQRASTAPGTRELTERLCGEALVMDLGELQRLEELRGEQPASRSGPSIRLSIACYVSDAARAPDCDQVARTYVHAVGTAAGEFMVLVSTGKFSGRNGTVCSRRYAPDGTPGR